MRAAPVRRAHVCYGALGEAGLDFAILGVLEARVAGRRVDVGGMRPSIVLALAAAGDEERRRSAAALAGSDLATPVRDEKVYYAVSLWALLRYALLDRGADLHEEVRLGRGGTPGRTRTPGHRSTGRRPPAPTRPDCPNRPPARGTSPSSPDGP